jgi:regulator of RNase E activity RraA
MTSGALVQRLRLLDTCAVSDALDRLGLPGAVHGVHAVWSCPRLAGQVITVGLRPPVAGEPARPHLGAAAITEASVGDVVLMAAGGRTDAAAWGGLLSLAAREKGVGGVIVDGACRDVDDSRDLGFPVYARAAVPTTARGRIVEDATGVPVEVGGRPVNTGDLAIADASGVVLVAAEDAERVIALAEELAAREGRLAQALRDGRPVLEVMDAGYEAMTRPSG